MKSKKLTGLDWFLLSLIAIILAGSAYIGSLAPINNSDSLQTHLPRIYYWIQHGSMENWNALINFQLSYPINIPIQGLWLFLLSHNEKLFFLVQWFSLVLSVILVVEITQFLGATVRHSLAGGVVALSFPALIMQSYSFQGDNFIAAIILCTVYLILLFVKSGSAKFLLLSALPMVIALGSKQTAFLFLPVYLLVIFILVKKKNIGVLLMRFIFIFLVSFILLAGYKYVQNSMHQEQVVDSMFSTSRYAVPFTKGTSVEGYATNILRYKYQWISLDGLNGQFYLSALRLKNNLFASLSTALSLDLESRDFITYNDEESFDYSNPSVFNEDASWFGLLSWTLIPIALIVALVRKEKIVRYYALFSLLVTLLFFLSIAVLITSWSPTNGRYMSIPVLLLTPLISFIIPSQKKYGIFMIFLISLISTYLAFSTLLTNRSRPIITTNSLNIFYVKKIETINMTNLYNKIYRSVGYKVITDLILTSANRQNILRGSYYDKLLYQNPGEVQDIQFVNANIPTKEPLYINTTRNYIEYALFGVNRERNLYPVYDLKQVPPGAYVLISNDRLAKDKTDFKLIASNENYSIMIRH